MITLQNDITIGIKLTNMIKYTFIHNSFTINEYSYNTNTNNTNTTNTTNTNLNTNATVQ